MNKKNTQTRLPNLFGFNNRTRYIVGIAEHGPIGSRELGRHLEIDCARLPGLYRSFENLGVVRRDGHGILLDESFFAFSELAILLNAMAGRRVILVPDNRTVAFRRRIPLFGSASKTRLLTAIAASGNANLKDLALIARVHPRTVHGIVNGLERDGIVVSEMNAGDRLISLSHANPLMPLLHDLLVKMQEAFKDIPKRAAGHRWLVEDRAAFAAEAPTATALPIGTPLQAAALVALARFGTLTAGTLGEAINASRSSARTVASELSAYGLVVVKTMGSGPQRKRWIRLNEAHPIHSPLCRYVHQIHGVERRPGLPLPPKPLPSSTRKISAALPGHPLRTKIFVETYLAGEIDVAGMGKRLGRSDRKPIRRWAEDLHRAWLIDYGAIGGRMVLRARDTGPGTNHLRDLAAAIAPFRTSRGST